MSLYLGEKLISKYNNGQEKVFTSYDGTEVTPGVNNIVVPKNSQFTNDFIIKGDTYLKEDYIRRGISLWGKVGRVDQCNNGSDFYYLALEGRTINDLQYHNGIYVVGTDEGAYYSTNGIDWSKCKTGTTHELFPVKYVRYDEGIWYTVIANQLIFSSVNGKDFYPCLTTSLPGTIETFEVRKGVMVTYLKINNSYNRLYISTNGGQSFFETSIINFENDSLDINYYEYGIVPNGCWGVIGVYLDEDNDILSPVFFTATPFSNNINVYPHKVIYNSTILPIKKILYGNGIWVVISYDGYVVFSYTDLSSGLPLAEIEWAQLPINSDVAEAFTADTQIYYIDGFWFVANLGIEDIFCSRNLLDDWFTWPIPLTIQGVYHSNNVWFMIGNDNDNDQKVVVKLMENGGGHLEIEVSASKLTNINGIWYALTSDGLYYSPSYDNKSTPLGYFFLNGPESEGKLLTKYPFKKGMDWQSYLSSDYNIFEMAVDSIGIKLNGNYLIYEDSEEKVYVSDLIQVNCRYTT